MIFFKYFFHLCFWGIGRFYETYTLPGIQYGSEIWCSKKWEGHYEEDIGESWVEQCVKYDLDGMSQRFYSEVWFY